VNDKPVRADDDRAFSRRSQLSIKALRLYDRLGLLRPAAVDGRNGYRGYDESQLFTARLIVLAGREQIGPPREVYTPGAEPLFAADDAHICDVAIPVAESGASQNAG
jgi:hypothetical protein